MADNSVVEENAVVSSENNGEFCEEKVSRSDSPDSPKSDDEGLGVNSDEPVEKEAEAIDTTPTLDNESSSEIVEQMEVENVEKEECESVEKLDDSNEKTGNDEDPINVSDSEGVEEKPDRSLDADEKAEDEIEFNKQEEPALDERSSQENAPVGISEELETNNDDEIIDAIGNKTVEEPDGRALPSEMEVECEESPLENATEDLIVGDDEEEVESKFSRELSRISEKEDEVNEEQTTETKDNAPTDNEEGIVEENMTETISENVESSIANLPESEESKPVEELMDDVCIEQVEAAMIPETCSEEGDESTDVEVNLPLKYESDTQLQWAMEILLGKTLPVLDTTYRSIRNELESFYSPTKTFTIKSGLGIVEEPTLVVNEQVVQAEVNLGSESAPLMSSILDRNSKEGNGLLNNSGVDELDDTIRSDGSEGAREKEPMPEILSPKSPRKRFSLRQLLCSRGADD